MAISKWLKQNKTKRFGNQQYSYYGWETLKSAAQKKAELFRKRTGGNARVVKITLRSGGSAWGIYVKH